MVRAMSRPTTLDGFGAAPERRRSLAPALLLSLALHLAVALSLAWDFTPAPQPQPEEAAIAVELAPEPRPAAREEGEKPAPAPAPAPAAPAAPPPPVLEPARLAETSQPGEQAKAKPAAGKPAPISPRQAKAARDLILSQVLRHWRPPAELRGLGAVVTLKVDLLAGGMLGPPFGRDARWDPASAIDGLEALPPADPRRQMLEALYRALRQAQPLTLPPELAPRLPMAVALDFRVDDLPR